MQKTLAIAGKCLYSERVLQTKTSYSNYQRQPIRHMPLPNENDSLITLKRLSSNDDYYNIVFKKTERIASAVFYILSHVEVTDTNRVLHTRLSDKAMALHESVITSLDLFEYEVVGKIHTLQSALVSLASTVHIATAAGLVTPDIESVVTEEIDGVLRYLRNHYLVTGSQRSTFSSGGGVAPRLAPTTPRSPRRQRPQIPLNDLSSDAVLVYSNLNDRTSRIKTVLEAKPEATIKDLSEIITDVSTKTIQRDLNSLIDSGEVIRQGERRWSKYSIAK